MKKLLLPIIIILALVISSIVIFRNFSHSNKAKENLSSEQTSQASAKPEFPDYDSTVQKQGDSYVVTNPTSILVLVNKKRMLPSDYVPEGLVKPNVLSNAGKSTAHPLMRKEAADALEKLFKGAEKDGITLYLVSGYRSYQSQETLFKSYVKKQGKENAEQVSAVPGTSEHQTGLAVDITSKSSLDDLNASFGETPEGKWVKDHAHEYGFVISYPEDKISITGYAYEPWHIRYVGNPQATYLYEHNLTLEEAMKQK